MSQDFANLSFNIDSSQVNRANEQLMLLGERSTFAADHAQSLTRIWNEAGSGLLSFNGSLQSFNTTLQDTVVRLQAARGAVDGFLSGFERFTQARDNAQAMATALGSTAQGLENFTRQAASFGMNADQTATAINRVTQAILGQTAAGRQLRQIMQDYGVNFQGLRPANADQALEQFVYNSQHYRTTQFSTQAMQTVLGPMNPQQIWQLQQRDMESPYERRLRVQMEVLERQVAATTQNAGQAGHYWAEQRRLSDDYTDNYRIRQWYTPFLHPLSPGSGLSETQAAQIMHRLGLRGDPFTRENQLRIFQYAEQHPGQYGNGAVWQWGDLGRAISPMVAPGTYGAYAANLAVRRNAALQRSETGWLNPEAWGQWLGAEGDYWGGRARLFGYWASGQLGRLGPPPALAVPQRPLSANDLYQQQLASAQGLAEQGFYGAAQYVSGDARLRALRQGRAVDLRDLARFYGPETGAETYNNAAYLARQQRDLATEPGGGQLLSGRMVQWLMSAAPGDRARAQALLQFAQQNNIATAPWVDHHLSLAAVLRRPGTAAGQLSAAQIGAFGRIQGYGDRTQIQAENESAQHYLDIQRRIQEAIPQGAAAVQEATAHWQTYYQVLDSTHNGLLADNEALNAQARALADVNTAMDRTVELMRQAALNSEFTAVFATQAGSNPVTRGAASLLAGLHNSTQRMRRAGASDAQIHAAIGSQSDQWSGQAIAGGSDAVGNMRYQVDLEMRLAQAGAARADALERINSDMQVEKSFQQQLAEASAAVAAAPTAAHKEAYDAIVKQMDAVKQLAFEYQRLKDATADLSFSRDLSLNTGFQQQMLHMNPEQLRVWQALQPVIRQYGNTPALMGHPTGFMGSLGTAGAPYDSYFLQASAATGGRLSPEVMAVLAYREGSFQANPAQNIGGAAHRGMMQFDTNTARRMHLAVNGTRDDRLNPSLAIPAAGAYLGTILDRLGITGPVTDIATLHRVLGAGGYGSSFNPQIDALYNAALQGPDTSPGAIVARVLRGQVGGLPGHDIATAQTGLTAQEAQQAREAAWQGGYAQMRLRAAIAASRAGTGQFGQSYARDIIPNPTLPAGVAAVNARYASEADLGQFGLGLAGQGASLTQTARDVESLAKAWSQGTLAGEAFQRTLANNDQIAQLRAMARLYPELAKVLDEYIARLRAYNTETERNYQLQVTADFYKQSAALSDQNEVARAGLAAGPLASPQAVALAQARVTAQRTVQESGGRISFDQAYGQQAQQIALRDQVQMLQQVRQGFHQMGSDAMDAFNTAVVGSTRLHWALYQITKDIESMALKTLVEQPFMNLVQHSVFDPLSGAIGGALGFGSSSSGPSAGASAASTAGNAAVSAAGSGLLGGLFHGIASFLGFAQGGVIDEYGRPSRYLASGGLIDRPTRIYAASGTVMAGENAPEAILPLKRLPNGNLGVATSGGGGHTIIVQAPITVQGNPGGSGSAPMDPAASQALQRHFEMIATKAMRNVLVNEMRPGGDLYMAGATQG